MRLTGSLSMPLATTTAGPRPAATARSLTAGREARAAPAGQPGRLDRGQQRPAPAGGSGPNRSRCSARRAAPRGQPAGAEGPSRAGGSQDGLAMAGPRRSRMPVTAAAGSCWRGRELGAGSRGAGLRPGGPAQWRSERGRRSARDQPGASGPASANSAVASGRMQHQGDGRGPGRSRLAQREPPPGAPQLRRPGTARPAASSHGSAGCRSRCRAHARARSASTRRRPSAPPARPGTAAGRAAGSSPRRAMSRSSAMAPRPSQSPPV